MDQEKLLNICRKCKATCCKLGGTDFTKKEMQRIVNAGHKIKFKKINENHYEFKTNKKAECLYLKNDACTIYNERPSACRCWPVEYPDFEGKKKRFTLVYCPLTPYLSKEYIQQLKKIANKIPRKLGEDEKGIKDKKYEEMAPCIRRLPTKKRERVIKKYNKFKLKELK